MTHVLGAAALTLPPLWVREPHGPVGAKRQILSTLKFTTSRSRHRKSELVV